MNNDVLKEVKPSGDLLVRIQNYQILKDVKVKFVEGLNVIIGPSNNGKSSLVRALEAVYFNKQGNNFINNNAETCTVSIKQGNNVINWMKFKATGTPAKYMINGQEYNKIGRAPLDEVSDLTNIREIDILGVKERINFWKQMDYPFLLNKTPAQLFNFLAMSSEQDNLASVFKQMKEDAKVIDREIISVEGRITEVQEQHLSLTSQVQRFVNFDIDFASVLKLEKKVGTFNLLETRIASARELVNEIKSKQEDYKNLTKVYNSVKLEDKTHRGVKDYTVIKPLVEKVIASHTKAKELMTELETVKTTLANITLVTIKQKQEQVSKLNVIIKQSTQLEQSIEVVNSELSKK